MLSLQITETAAVIHTADGRVAEYVPGDGAKRRPYIHPISLPGGPPLTANRPSDHVHHHGLWVGHHLVESGGRVDDFYLERGDEGEILHEGYENVVASGDVVGFTALHRWVAGDGFSPLIDRWDVRVGQYENGDIWMDLRLELRAVAGPVTLRSTNESALPLVRVAEPLSGQNGGVITNSRGATKEWMTFGRRAEWVDYSGPVPGGAWQGLAILDHPRNPAFPSPWFTRDYGPFGPSPNCFDGDLYVMPWRPLLLRYRVIVHRGSVAEARVAERWQDFVVVQV
ncbi:MAG: PmoA family protein [Bacillota bacterium]